MRIAVFGLGYVGCATGACLAQMGHEVCGVDISPMKVRMINQGRAPLRERGIRESPSCQLVKALVEGGKKVKVYDSQVDLQSLLGANRAYVESALPELARLLVGLLEPAQSSRSRIGGLCW